MGDKLIINAHDPEHCFYKGFMGIVKNISGGFVNGIFKIINVSLNYCTTSHKYQGHTINENYNIHQTNIMSFENIYTTFPRCSNLE